MHLRQNQISSLMTNQRRRHNCTFYRNIQNETLNSLAKTVHISRDVMSYLAPRAVMYDRRIVLP